jgi:hypothetical protein
MLHFSGASIRTLKIKIRNRQSPRRKRFEANKFCWQYTQPLWLHWFHFFQRLVNSFFFYFSYPGPYKKFLPLCKLVRMGFCSYYTHSSKLSSQLTVSSDHFKDLWECFRSTFSFIERTLYYSHQLNLSSLTLSPHPYLSIWEILLCPRGKKKCDPETEFAIL